MRGVGKMDRELKNKLNKIESSINNINNFWVYFWIITVGSVISKQLENIMSLLEKLNG